jgi:MFS transporter, AAHS family, 3-hydroxyphenylpropionic acid transporter
MTNVPLTEQRPETAVDGVAVTVMLCALAAFFEGIDLQAAGVAAAGIIPEFKPDPRHLGVFFSASTLGLVFGALIGGRLCDRIGRKRVLVGSVAVFGLFSLLAASASSMPGLVWARFLTGLGLGGAFPILVALTAESSTAARRSSNVALVYSGMPFGGAFVSLLSFLIAPVHWRALFVVGGICPVIVAPIMAVYLRESPVFRQSRRDAATPSAPPQGFRAVLAEGRTRNTLLLWVGFLLSLLTLYLLLNWLPTLLLGYGLSKSQAAIAQIAFNLGGAIASLGMGRLLDGAHARPSMAAVFAALPLLLASLALAPRQPAAIVSIVLVLGIVLLMSQAGLYTLAPQCYPTRIRGVGVGTAVAVGRVGSIIGPAIAGVLVARGQSTSQLLLDLVPISAVAGICALLLAWRVIERRPGD